MGTAPLKNNHLRAKRDVVQGWSMGATRRNIAFLRSINESTVNVSVEGEPLIGYACTFTLRDCPPTHADWEKLRDTFVKRLRRLGLIKFHWVTEWQRRGVPHLHAAFFFREPLNDADEVKLRCKLYSSWFSLAFKYGVHHLKGQHIVPISDPIGWFKYMAKHAARGVNHYQRSSDSIPSGWEKTGRMWGKGGEWDISEGRRFVLSEAAYFIYRRIAKAWRIADARSSLNGFRIVKARNMLKCSDEGLSKLRGVSEWISERESFLILTYVQSMGGIVTEKKKKVDAGR